MSIAKHKIKDEIRESSTPFDVRPKWIFDEISKEMGFLCPEYNSLRTQIARNINKRLPSDIK